MIKSPNGAAKVTTAAPAPVLKSPSAVQVLPNHVAITNPLEVIRVPNLNLHPDAVAYNPATFSTPSGERCCRAHHRLLALLVCGLSRDVLQRLRWRRRTRCRGFGALTPCCK